MTTLPGLLRCCGELALDMLLPRTCLHCHADLRRRHDAPLCPQCITLLKPLPQLFCKRCGVPLPDGGAHCFRCRGVKARKYKCGFVRSAFVFEGPARSLVHHLKYRGRTDVAPFLAGYLRASLDRFGELAPFLQLVAVPVARDRLRERGYNQSQLLACELAGLAGLEHLDGALEKVRQTRPQVGLGHAQRLENLAGAFEGRRELVKGKSILLVDDVATTGATLEACAVALKKAGARRVAALTVARE